MRIKESNTRNLQEQCNQLIPQFKKFKHHDSLLQIHLLHILHLLKWNAIEFSNQINHPDLRLVPLENVTQIYRIDQAQHSNLVH
jgi:hypothetical protein